ncbi:MULTISPECIES: TrkA family potassium uptake protein [unclassified Streptomyces]|uniref:potassium channel family protein n=1 Tax=unclassified Streptomyces TaxID=2593676 RepID=UPI0005A8D83B|nr:MULTISPECIES: NAD(P)-binding protein [unclassified Streptomyces]ODA73300.1 potassium transporter peripheral membrane component [Streptomyces sp. AVP053U2]
MLVCGDDGLAHRLAAELRGVYGEQVTLVVPPSGLRVREPVVGRARAASAALLDRFVNATVNRAGAGGGSDDPSGELLVEAAEPTDAVLAEVGVAQAAALALVYDDDETNIRAALNARRINPGIRLVLRLYNRRLGRHIEDLLDQAAELSGVDTQGRGHPRGDASTTVLSDADTAAPALVATALVGTSKIVDTDGLMLRAVERRPPRPGEVTDPGLCTLALLSATSNDPAGSDGSEDSGDQGPQMLPDAAAVAAATGRGTMVLEQVSYSGPPLPAVRAGVPPFASLFSQRLRWSLAGLAAAVVVLAVVLALVTDDHPLHATYVTLLDLFAINEPAHNQSMGRQILQLLTGLVGLLLLPVMLAAVLEALGTFRIVSALRKPPRGLSRHVVLLGLGKIGTRVLTRLRELHIPVVCVEADPEARGMATARRLGVPVVLGDVTQEGVLEAAKIHRADAFLALTSVDTTNLEAVLYARAVRADLRVVLRLYDDEFATAVYRTLRAAHPDAVTRSRSVSHLAAPAFAGAMMGRQILGAIPVERRVLLFAALTVGGHPQLEGKTVGEAFRAGAWRVLALDTAAPRATPGAGGNGSGHGSGNAAGPGAGAGSATGGTPAAGEPTGPTGLVWDLPDTYVLRNEDRVVLGATRRGLAELLGRRGRERSGR